MSSQLQREAEMLRERLATLEAKMRQPPDYRNELSAIQARYDAVGELFGQNEYDLAQKRPLPIETPLQYRQRRLMEFTKHSPSCKNVTVNRLGEDNIGIVEKTVIADAQAASYDTSSYKPGELKPITYKDEAGRPCTRWVGDPMGWLQHFCTGGQVGSFNQKIADRAWDDAELQKAHHRAWERNGK
jgi:hypothetical protein